MKKRSKIPAIWRIDIEPDDHAPQVGQQPWRGFVAMFELVEKHRATLSERSGHTAQPNWFVRLDLDIERCFSRADFVVHEYQDLFAKILNYQDPLGIHVHYLRWDEARQVVFSEHSDQAWMNHCFKFAAENFERTFGQKLRLTSQGGYFLSEATIDNLIKMEVAVDVTPEPGLPPKLGDVSLGAYCTEPTPDYRQFPRRPYFPSRAAMHIAARSQADVRPLVLIPLSSLDYDVASLPWYRQIARKILRRPSKPRPLNVWRSWGSPKNYWDLVAKAADDQPARYFTFAMRTDPPEAQSFQNVKALLDYLPLHPISERLQFVDARGKEMRALAAQGVK